MVTLERCCLFAFFSVPCNQPLPLHQGHVMYTSLQIQQSVEALVELFVRFMWAYTVVLQRFK